MNKLLVILRFILLFSIVNLATISLSGATVVKNFKNQNISTSGNLVPTGKGWGKKVERAPEITRNLNVPQNGIYYHGGEVMGISNNTTPNLYYIWYGNWAKNTAINLLTNLALGIGKTPYFNINTTYTNGSGTPIIRAVNFPKPGIFDNYSLGKALSDDNILAIVTNAINKNQLPLDPNGIYFVLTSADVNETSGFCTSYCGWHTNATVKNTNIKYGFIGNAARCPNSCSSQTITPNNNLGADAMASIIAHELEETVTDPNGDAWYDKAGEENGDKCAWQFGHTKTISTGAKYNLVIGFKNYLVQMNWLNANGGMCVNSH